MAKLTLRRANEIDIPILAKMNREFYDDDGAAPRATIAELELRVAGLLKDGFVAVLVEEGEEPVGYVLYRITPKFVYVNDFFIERPYRGNGFGTETFNALLAEYWDNAASVQVDVSETSASVKAFWDSLGFERRFVRLELETARKSKTRKACGAVVYRKWFGRTQYLLIHQVAGDFWGFPKGHVDKGESERQTAFREILEETGLRVRFKRGFCERTHYLTQSQRKKEVVLFLSQIRRQTVRIDQSEIDDYRWLSYDDALELLPYENLRIVLSNAREYLTGRITNRRELKLY